MAKLVDIQGQFFLVNLNNKKPTLIKNGSIQQQLYPPNNAFTSDNTFYISNN